MCQWEIFIKYKIYIQKDPEMKGAFCVKNSEKYWEECTEELIFRALNIKKGIGKMGRVFIMML